MRCNVVLPVLFLSGVQSAAVLCCVESGSSVCRVGGEMWAGVLVGVRDLGCVEKTRASSLAAEAESKKALPNHGRL